MPLFHTLYSLIYNCGRTVKDACLHKMTLFDFNMFYIVLQIKIKCIN
jgi:hypothetical protein